MWLKHLGKVRERLWLKLGKFQSPPIHHPWSLHITCGIGTDHWHCTSIDRHRFIQNGHNPWRYRAGVCGKDDLFNPHKKAASYTHHHCCSLPFNRKSSRRAYSVKDKDGIFLFHFYIWIWSSSLSPKNHYYHKQNDQMRQCTWMIKSVTLSS